MHRWLTALASGLLLPLSALPAAASTSTSTVPGNTVAQGATANIEFSLELTRSQPVTVDVDVNDAAGDVAWNQQWPGEQFQSGETRTFQTAWPVPGEQLPGRYSLTIKAFDSGGRQVYADGGQSPFDVTVGPQTFGAAMGSPSGQPLPLGNLPGWRQVFSDDFTASVPLGSFPNAVADKWTAYADGTPDTSHNGVYMPSQVLSEHDGVLDMWIHSVDGQHLVSAPIPRIPGAPGNDGGLLYGRYAVRFKADALPGYKTAWLLWPDSDQWPSSGEIDFPEGNLNENLCGYLHHLNGSSGKDQDEYCSPATFTQWHTAVTEWTPNSVKFFLDGLLVGASTSPIPDSPLHWVLQTETNLDGYSPSDSVSGHVLVDWVTAYAWA